ELDPQLPTDQSVVTTRAERPSIQPDVPWTGASIAVRPNEAMDLPRRSESPLAIEDYALIGDCRTAALVGRNGSIDWLCLPRFDSNACSATLRARCEEGRGLISPADPKPRVSRAYRDDTMVLDTVFETADGRVALIDFMPIGQANSSLIRLVKGQRGK